MITLYQFARTWGIPNLSHFCVKVETYLRMVKLPYQVIATLPFKAPLGKLPFIEDGSMKIADSRLMLRYLKSAYGDALDAHLGVEEKSLANTFQRLIEEHLYWASMITRWRHDDQNWQTNKQAIFGVLPPIVRDLAALAYHRRINSQILGQGMGRLAMEEVFQLGQEDIDSLANFLADKPYFMGDQPSSLDATGYGFLVNILGCPIESPLKNHALNQKNLLVYCRRMQSEYFPEFSLRF
ncbi:MAG: glutathione S-transferase family protein [Methylococcaceae bacterium]|nr:glutathione S-transferase family protein [Methylococcaceae bacterium]